MSVTPRKPLPRSTPNHERNLALLVAGAFFMEFLDGTILTTSIPVIARSLGVGAARAGITITAYMLVLAVLIPLSGWIAERSGTRRVFISAIAVFTLGSLACALSGSLLELTAARIAQGVGGAMMVPVGRLAVLNSTPKERLVSAIAYLTWPALTAPVIAPLLGGAITTYASWHWIFIINIPLGIIALVAAWFLVPATASRIGKPLDWRGFALVGLGLGLLAYAASAASAAHVDWRAVAAESLAGTAFTAGAILHLRRALNPLLEFSPFATESFRVAHTAGSVFRLTVSAVPFLLPLMFELAFHWSPIRAGSLVLLLYLGNVGIKPLTTPLLRWFGFRPVMLAATASLAVSLLLSAALTSHTPILAIGVLMVFSGAARSVGFTAYNTVAFADVDQAAMNRANTLASTLQQLAAGFGIALGAVLLQAALGFRSLEIGLGATSAGIDPYRFSFLALAALSVLAALGAARASSDIGLAARPQRA